MYYVAWRVIKTGETDNRSMPFYTRKDAEAAVKNLNELHEGFAVHWIEEVNSDHVKV